MMLGNDFAANEVLRIASETSSILRGAAVASDIDTLIKRLEGPMRIAIAGRVKSGKSTLLNALVGERLAATDAGECTRIVTWYEHALGYDVTARLLDGTDRSLPYRRSEGAVHVELGALDVEAIDRMIVHWPASSLKPVTLIDTPGLASMNDENSRRTRDFLHPDAGNSQEADAVIYLMRHLHRLDVEFLDAFMDRSVSAASPVNSVAVLSRADEVGAGRIDAMESAGRIAGRYESDSQVQTLAARVVPVAGLLAETGLTLREDEVASLRAIASVDSDVRKIMLLSADHFCDFDASDVTVETRRSLLDRFGMFGLRTALSEVERGVTTAAELAPRLVRLSGLGELKHLIDSHFIPRSRVLQARTALAALHGLLPQIRQENADVAATVAREVEIVESSAIDFVRLRSAHLLASRAATVRDSERADLENLLLSTDAGGALGLGDSDASALREAAMGGVSRWRSRAGDPLADPTTVEVYETAARTCEVVYAECSGR